MHLASRLGGASARHPWRALAVWAFAILVAISLIGQVEIAKLTQAEQSSGEASAAERVLERAGFKHAATEQVLVQVRGSGTVLQSDPRRAIADVVDAVKATGRVHGLRSPLAPAGSQLISPDKRSALVQFEMNGKRETAEKRVQPLLDAVSGVARAHPGLRVEEFGAASAGHALNKTIGRDFSRAETLSIPLTLVILLLAFGALMAAFMPLGLGLVAVLTATSLMAVTSQVFHVDSSASTLVLLIGLAVGVDYSLFYVRRQREERAAGRSNAEAIGIAAATSGRAVLTSGLTVIIAMGAMYLTGQGTFMGMAVGTMLVVAVAVVGSLTMLPALLALLGDRVERGRLPWLGRWLATRRAQGDSRAWSAILSRVLRHPGLAATGAATLLVVLAVPALGLKTAVPGATDIPPSMPIIKTYHRIMRAFPGGPTPAQVVVKAPSVTSPAVVDSIASFERAALATGVMHEPITTELSPDRTVAVVRVPLTGDSTSRASQDALRTLRERVIPATIGRVASVKVTGPTAISADFGKQLSDRTPYVFAFVLGLAFLLMLWSFRSLVVATTTIVLNLLSVGAAYGVLVSVFQHGHGGSLIGLHSTGPLASWLPLFLFVILFGLSMDYHVFLLSRIREAHDQGLSTRDAVFRGISSSAGVITSAAIVMVAVFSTFATLSLVSLKQLGVGLAVAVLLDATVVRAVLLPAVMTLLGEHNWYLPRSLAWIPGAPPEPVVPRHEGVRDYPSVGSTA